MAARPIIKLFGERNSGTKYLQQLLMLNLDADLLRGEVPSWASRLVGSMEFPRDLYFQLTYRWNLGWKHSSGPSAETVRRYADSRHVNFVTITKNPYAWLLSMYRRPYHHKGVAAATFAEFLSQPWKTVGRENHDLGYENPIILWNDKNRSYLRLGDYARCTNLRYEALLADPAGTLGALARTLGIAFNGGSFTDITASAKQDKQSTADYRDYYLNERWKAKFDPPTLSIVNRHLDATVAQKLGYRIFDGN